VGTSLSPLISVVKCGKIFYCVSCQPILEIHGLIDGVLVVLPSIGCMVEHIIPTLSLKHVAKIYILWLKQEEAQRFDE
jgi:hypothetical protein